MGTGRVYVPQYRGNLLVEGCSYQVSIRIQEGQEAQEVVPAHNHPNHELFAVMEGAASMQIGNHPEQTYRRGTCCVIDPHTYHMRRASQEQVKYCAMAIACPRRAPIKHLEGGCTLLRCAPEVLGCVAAIEQELEAGGLGSESRLQALATLLLVAVLRELSELRPLRTVQPSSQVLHYEEVIDDYIALHYDEDLRVGELAAQVGITPRHLARIMQQRYHCTFQQHLTGTRLFHAKKYLSETDQPIGNIAILCGFASESSFSTTFRKHVGCSPSQYRKDAEREA